MRKIICVVFVAALVFGVAGAWAAEIDGKIQKVDKANRTIVLQDGTLLWIGEGVRMETLKEGVTVKCSFEERDGKAVVEKIEVVR